MGGRRGLLELPAAIWAGWEAKFRERLELELAGKDLILMLGNMHRFQHQWLAVSLIYPPKQRPEGERQGSLFPE